MKSLTRLTFFLTIALFYSIAVLGQTKPKFTQPILLTSAGQSADVTLAGMVFNKKLNIPAKVSAMAKPSELEGVKTLVIVAGFSSKGLGAAGISREQELARVKEIIAAAKEKKISIVLMHLGGKPRRGNQSDDFNKMAAEASNYMLVVKQGDEDQFFSTIATKSKTPIDIIDKIADAVKPLGEVFK